jgi:hypothetical protein
MVETILLIGNCGSGKTWCMINLIKKLELNTKARIGKVIFQTDGSVSVLGNYEGSTFQGSDKLSMSVMTDFAILRKMQRKNSMNVICEGDRFMNKKFISMFQPIVIKITDDGENGRSLRGSSQSMRQVKSIKTRVENTPFNKAAKNSSEALEMIMHLLNE